MYVFLFILIAVISFFVWANWRTKKVHSKFGRTDVESALEEFLSPDSTDHDEWDLFLSHPIGDPYYESIRQRCRKIVERHAQAGNSAENSKGACDQIQAIFNEVKNHA